MKLSGCCIGPFIYYFCTYVYLYSVRMRGFRSSVYLYRSTLIFLLYLIVQSLPLVRSTVIFKQIKILNFTPILCTVGDTAFMSIRTHMALFFCRYFQHITVSSQSSLSALATAIVMTTYAAAVISWLMVTLLINWTVVMPTLSCRISEFMCKSTGGCIQLDEFCDGKYDCPDRSDEPPSCTGRSRPRIVIIVQTC